MLIQGENIELQVNILKKNFISIFFTCTHNLFLNLKLNRGTKKRQKHMDINLRLLMIQTKLKILVHMTGSVKQIGETVIKCLLKDIKHNLFEKRYFQKKEDIKSSREQRSKEECEAGGRWRGI